MTEPKRHHYLPQFYQKGFCILPTAEPFKLWVYDFRLKNWEIRTTINTAARKDFYTLTKEDGGKDNSIEGYLSGIESQTKEIMDRKIIKNLKPGMDKKAILAIFVTLLRLRVPFVRNTLEKIHLDLLQKSVGMMRERAEQDPKYLEWLSNQIEKDTGQKIDITLEVMSDMFNKDKYKIKFDRSYLLSLIFNSENVEKIANIFCQMKWKLYVTKNEDPFISSDNPFHEFNPQFYGSRTGLLNPEIEVTMPLTRNHCLYLSYKHKEKWFEYANREKVAEINRRTVIGCQELVISPTQSFPGDDIISRLKDAKNKRLMEA